jgi:twitching motility protein PilT
MDIKTLLKMMVERNASDLFYRMAGTPRLKIDGKVVSVGESTLSQQDLSQALDVLMTPQQKEKFKTALDVDFAFYTDELERRFRVSIFMQRNHPSIVIRNINCNIMNFEELNLPASIFEKLSRETRGLVLLTGTMGSGKSTTIAGIIEYINKNLKKHILTVEEPIEFTFKDKEAIINQRELGLDVSSYATALRAFTLQSPDVMYISNIRDQETMQAALTAAETGVLVLSTIHSVNASQSVERIINFFPPHQHQEVRNQLSYLLKGVISLRLIPLKDGTGRIPAYEILLLTPTISRLIREGKIWEIPQYIEEGGVFGMNSFNQCLVKLVKEGKINEAEAVDFVDSKDEFSLALKGIKKER